MCCSPDTGDSEDSPPDAAADELRRHPKFSAAGYTVAGHSVSGHSAAGLEKEHEQADHSVQALATAYEGLPTPESVRMLQAILKGSQMGPHDGWFGPAESRYDWSWLARKHAIAPDEDILIDQFLGPPEWFLALDRNHDSRIAADDLDWLESNPWAQQSYFVNRIFRKIETAGDGRLTREEWDAFFETAAQGRDYLLFEDLRNALLGRDPIDYMRGDEPSQALLIRGLFSGELGSLQSGPHINARAPDFTLTTCDGAQSLHLADFMGERPIVLMFGNFTCPPFRSMVPGVCEIHQRYQDVATFLAVYVREAHPVDGWKLESNNRVGVAVPQPQTYDERVALAERCRKLLRLTMPLLVDGIDDAVGHAYSAMPARLYVIDRDGRVTYKGGRGPFGFKSGEMEQALVMTLLDHSQRPPATAAPEPRTSGPVNLAELDPDPPELNTPLPA